VENNLAALVTIYSDIVRSYDQMCGRWYTDKNRHEHFSISAHLDEESAMSARLRAFLDDLTKEAARQGAITIAEIDDDSRAYEATHPGV